MHLLLVLSLVSLLALPACWNPFSKSDTATTECCGCTSSDDATVCAEVTEETAVENQDPMLDAAGVTEEADYSSDKQ